MKNEEWDFLSLAEIRIRSSKDLETVRKICDEVYDFLQHVELPEQPTIKA